MKLTIRMWILIVVLLFSFLAIAPWQTFEKGVVIKSIEKNSSAYDSGLKTGFIIKQINDYKVKDLEEYSIAIENIFSPNKTTKVNIITDQGEFIYLANSSYLSVSPLPNSNLKTGLDLRGGARALVKAENATLTKEQADDLLSITTERLNAFGLSDVVLKTVSDLSGQNYLLIEIAGSTSSELKELLESAKGKFEAQPMRTNNGDINPSNIIFKFSSKSNSHNHFG